MRHIPIRTCFVCRERKDKTLLRRFVLTPRGLLYDYYQNISGRGVYICFKEECKKKFLNRKFQKRFFKRG